MNEILSNMYKIDINVIVEKVMPNEKIGAYSIDIIFVKYKVITADEAAVMLIINKSLNLPFAEKYEESIKPGTPI